MNIMVQENLFSTSNVTVRIQSFIWRKLTIMDLQVNKLIFCLLLTKNWIYWQTENFIFQTVQVIIVTICNQLAKILASVFPVLSDTLTDGVSGSTTIITAKQCMQNHKLLSLNAMKELVLDSLVDMLQGTAEYLKFLRIQPFRFEVLMFGTLEISWSLPKSNFMIFFT